MHDIVCLVCVMFYGGEWVEGDSEVPSYVHVSVSELHMLILYTESSESNTSVLRTRSPTCAFHATTPQDDGNNFQRFISPSGTEVPHHIVQGE